LAERQGFEPWEPVKVQQLSRLLLSAAQPPLRIIFFSVHNTFQINPYVSVVKAEREGFEPPVPLLVLQFSRLVRSAAPAPLHEIKTSTKKWL
jgi:hypothetical protein